MSSIVNIGVKSKSLLLKRNSQGVEEHNSKLKRSSIVIKSFMVLILCLQLMQYYDTGIIDMGDVAGTLGVLALLRGFLLSPDLLTNRARDWSSPSVEVSAEGKKYFLLAAVLIVVSGL